MSTPEGKVKDKVKKLLTLFGAYQHWPVQTGFGAPALDCNGIHVGRGFAVETKAPGKKLTPRQELIKRDIEAAGGVVFVVGEKLAGKSYSGMRELAHWLQQKP